jgi:predicted MFS family arabinose efflux permease
MAIAKIVGSFAAGRLARLSGARITVGGMLGASSVSAALLIGVDGAVLYIALTVSAVFFGIGAWPIIVDGALARVWPADRARITIAWNVREYTAIALTTVVGGYLLDVFTGPAILLGFAATLLGCAALSALIVLRAPMHPPAEPQDAQARVGIA